MNEKLVSKKFIAFGLLLLSLNLMRVFGLIDGAQYMLGFLALGGGYLGIDYIAERSKVAP